ncbi:MAG: hypothetical protein EOP42_09110 [Sphingobacteriaceae bacterium]|nr:MAG: hypothetical protein EOP42_09110 [Sphingobacteriaceae bacterium]
MAWATYYDLKGNPHPESSSWVANGFNWTGTFYSVGVSIPTPWGINLVGSYFSSNFSQMRHVLNKRIKPKDEHVWWGVSIGISGGLPKALPTELFSLAKLALDSTLGFARTEYSLVYGNGHDFNTIDGNVDISGWQGLQRDKSMLGWHLGVNQNNY